MLNTYVVGDVHGCFYTLKNLLSKLEKNSEIIFVGDLCDRGLYSKEVIELIIQNKYKSILGNHDEYMIMHAIESINGIDNRWFREDYMGGKQTIESYKNDIETLKRHITWLKTLPRYIMIEKYFITHGFGLPYFQRKNSISAYEGLIKNRIEDKEDWGYDWEHNWEKYDVINIFGHTDYEKVQIGNNYYGIDTGCVYGRKLTAIKLNNMKIIEENIDKRDIYLID
ncbi:metallophosphoesterase family protein [Malaciobacter mytili]|uniref:metallophosphoesterase family protein n=1 Tax=Malaciobacter mytili TaxID=603050 RepID=UPI0013E94356|nr:metallophosphoesterase family protein [Malaciobacter mytili]